MNLLHIMVSMLREQKTVPFSGPGVQGGHALPSESVQAVDNVFEVESVRRRERNLHEVRVLELAVSGEVVNDGNFSGRFGLGLGLGPNLGSLRTCFSVCPFLRDLISIIKKSLWPY